LLMVKRIARRPRHVVSPHVDAKVGRMMA
jgi:hypothetical protein